MPTDGIALSLMRHGNQKGERGPLDRGSLVANALDPRAFYSRTRVHRPVTRRALFRILREQASGPIAGRRCPKLTIREPPIRAIQGESSMSRSPFSRLSLVAATIGAVAIAAFTVTRSRAAEEAVIIPAPAVDVQGGSGIQT